VVANKPKILVAYKNKSLYFWSSCKYIVSWQGPSPTLSSPHLHSGLSDGVSGLYLECLYIGNVIYIALANHGLILTTFI
jgi:hypothetical protein